MKIDLFTVFPTFDINKLGKIGLHHWKGKTALILVQLPNLTVTRLNGANIQLLKVAKFYRRLYGKGRQREVKGSILLLVFQKRFLELKTYPDNSSLFVSALI